MSCCFCVISLTFKKLWCNLTYSIVIFKTSHISDGINLDESSHKSPLISSCRKAPLWAQAAATRRENKKTCQRVKLKTFLRWSLALCKKQNRKNWEMVYHWSVTVKFEWSFAIFLCIYNHLHVRVKAWTLLVCFSFEGSFYLNPISRHGSPSTNFPLRLVPMYSVLCLANISRSQANGIFFSKIRLLAYEQIACNAGSFQP